MSTRSLTVLSHLLAFFLIVSLATSAGIADSGCDSGPLLAEEALDGSMDIPCKGQLVIALETPTFDAGPVDQGFNTCPLAIPSRVILCRFLL